jgi:lycopene cyclase domain-containing protein
VSEKYLYLAINISCLFIPLAFSFYRKANFSKKWKFVLPSILITAAIFIAWDEAFTRLGIWGFNSRYTLGLYIFSLPLEEILFFICIPYACVFTYFALTHLIKMDYLFRYQDRISISLVIVLVAIGVSTMDLAYTSFCFLITAAFLICQGLILRPTYMGRFYFAFLFILIPFFLVNGILTGSFIEEPVVLYNNDENLNIRLGTIPVEDVIYGMLLTLMSITVSEELQGRLGRGTASGRQEADLRPDRAQVPEL